MQPALPLDTTVDKPPPESLRNDHDVYGKPNSMVRIGQAPLGADCEPPQREHDGSEEQREDLHPYV